MSQCRSHRPAVRPTLPAGRRQRGSTRLTRGSTTSPRRRALLARMAAPRRPTRRPACRRLLLPSTHTTGRHTASSRRPRAAILATDPVEQSELCCRPNPRLNAARGQPASAAAPAMDLRDAALVAIGCIAPYEHQAQHVTAALQCITCLLLGDCLPSMTVVQQQGGRAALRHAAFERMPPAPRHGGGKLQQLPGRSQHLGVTLPLPRTQ